MTKPLLLLDVDGPLNPYAAPPNRRPAGYQTFRLNDSSFHDPSGRLWVKGGIRVWLNPSHGPMLLALTELVDLVWATAWEKLANTLVGSVLGLPELPVIELPRRDSYPFGQIFKRGDVEAYVGDRAFAWIDDDFQAADYQWAADRTEGGHPTFLRWIDPLVGLTQLDVDLIADWAAELTTPPTTTTDSDA